MTANQMIIFRRVEHKYFIDRTTRTALEQDIRTFIPTDCHSGHNDGYVVRSLYFDTHDYMAYHEKMAGTAMRHKLRVRVYGETLDSTPFVRLEVKSRYNSIINKTTVDIPIEDYPEVEHAIMNFRLPPRRFLNRKDVSDEFFRIQRLFNMVPQVLVQYRRRAYEKKEINRVRLSFDDELVASKHLNLLGPLRRPQPLLKYGDTIFEIKVDGSVPYWLHNLIAKYDLQNEAISKFCYAIRGQARLSTLSRPDD
jgi:SPX domain protein involved in polyphosphate accumulation